MCNELRQYVENVLLYTGCSFGNHEISSKEEGVGDRSRGELREVFGEMGIGLVMG